MIRFALALPLVLGLFFCEAACPATANERGAHAGLIEKWKMSGTRASWSWTGSKRPGSPYPSKLSESVFEDALWMTRKKICIVKFHY